MPYATLIQGLSADFSVEEVRAYLETNIGFNIDVVGLTNVVGDKWALLVYRSTDIHRLYTLDLILHCNVRLRKDIGKCFRCQRFGHMAVNCGMPMRCVKCGGPHILKDSSIPSKEEEARRLVDPSLIEEGNCGNTTYELVLKK